jgi:hypothetical protein
MKDCGGWRRMPEAITKQLCYRCHENPLIAGGTAWCRDCTIEALQHALNYDRNGSTIARLLVVFNSNPEIPLELITALRVRLASISNSIKLNA